MVKVQEFKSRYFISIPKTKALVMGLEKGSIVDFDINERGNLVMTKIKGGNKK